MEKKQKHFLHKPEYSGGPKALGKFIQDNLRYPPMAQANAIEGVVIVEADIDHKGKVVETRILQSIGHGCDEEAARVVQLLNFEVAKNRGVRVLFHQRFNVQFKLPKPQPVPVPQQPQVSVQYQYTTIGTPPVPAEEKQPENTYSYTIQLG